MEVLLLAERLRVEERLLIEALAASGCDARLVTPEEIGTALITPSPFSQRWEKGDEDGEQRFLSLSGSPLPMLGEGLGVRDCPLILSRLSPTREATALAWALEDAGARVVNSPRAHDLLSRRDRLMRALLGARLAAPPATLAWGQEALLEAAGCHGWPVELLPLEGGQPGIVVEDREAAEAVIEHRAVLGSERVMLVRRAARDEEQRRLVIADDFIQVARFRDGGWVADETAGMDRALAVAVRRATGGQLLDVLYLPGDEPRVTLVSPLIGFRELQSERVDIAGAVAACLSGIGAARV